MNFHTQFVGPRGAKAKRKANALGLSRHLVRTKHRREVPSLGDGGRSRSTLLRKAILALALFLIGGGASSPGQIATQVPDNANPATLPPGVKPGMIRYVSQPNGWGRTKEGAIKDLHVRIFPWYERNFGNKPGFEIDWAWVSCVEVSAKRSWQADGRLWWYVEPVKGRSPERPARSGRFDGRR